METNLISAYKTKVCMQNCSVKTLSSNKYKIQSIEHGLEIIDFENETIMTNESFCHRKIHRSWISFGQ